MQDESKLSPQALDLKQQLLEKAKLICEDAKSIPEIDIPRLIRNELPEIEDYLAGKRDNINLETIEVGRQVIRDMLSYHKWLEEQGVFRAMKGGGTTGVPKRAPSLDYYDNRADLEGQYRTKYGQWIYDDKQSTS